MNIRSLLSSILIGAVASARSMTPMATIAAARLAGRKEAMARIGQTKSGLIEDALIVAAGVAIVALSTRPK